MAERIVTGVWYHYDVTERGNWHRLSIFDGARWRFFYYWRRVRVPWLAWVMFS